MFGSKKFWRSLANIGLGIAPGGAIVKTLGGLVLGELLPPESEEQSRFNAWVGIAREFEANDNLDDTQRWNLLVARVTEDLTEYYGAPPKIHDVMFNASAALKEARGEFQEDSPVKEG